MTGPAARRPGPAARAVLALLTLYRTAVSPLRPPACRFTPTCSGYAVEAITRFGLGRGAALAAGRLLRCHPFHAGGNDPVPPAVATPQPGDPAAGPPPSGRPHRRVTTTRLGDI